MAQTSRSLHHLHFRPCVAVTLRWRDLRWRSPGLRGWPLTRCVRSMLVYSCAVTLALAVGCSRREADRGKGAPAPRKHRATPVVGKTAPPNAAQRRLREAAAVLERYQTIAAKIRFTGDLFGQQMIGTGSYAQMRNPDPQEPANVLSRLDLRIQVRERTAAWQQVCDGKHLWTNRKLPDGGKPEDPTDPEKGYNRRLTRVDLAKVVAAAGGVSPDSSEPRAVGFSGLPHFIESLAAAFEFQGEQTGKIDSISMSVIEGRWQGQMLEEFSHEQRTAAEASTGDLSWLPERAPDSVVLFLGKEDLFPFRIVFRRYAGHETPRELVKLELYEVRFDAPLERQQFEFTARMKFNDETGQFIKSYRQR